LGKDLKDLKKELRKELKKSAEKSFELSEDLAKDLKKSAKSIGKEFEKDTKKAKQSKESKKEKDSGWLVWVLIVVLFVIGLTPVALILLLVKLFGGKGKRGPVESAPRREGAAKKPAKAPAGKSSAGKWLQIGGVIVMAFALLGNWDALTGALSGQSHLWGEVISMLAGLVGGGVMLWAGRRKRSSLMRYSRYLLVLEDREAVSVEELARTLGYSRRRVEQDLEKMIDQGYFGGKAYLHRELGYLLRGGNAAAVLQQQEKVQPVADEMETEYTAILRKIRLANDRIEDEVLSAKIDRIEEVTAGIFRAVEQEPEKKNRIQTFLNYYLPTTQKLLDSYAEFEKAGVEGENLRQAKQRIEATMDKIVEGFEHQLDELYRADAMDVDSDIRVMETMLRRDTASVARDFGVAVQMQSDAES